MVTHDMMQVDILLVVLNPAVAELYSSWLTKEYGANLTNHKTGVTGPHQPQCHDIHAYPTPFPEAPRPLRDQGSRICPPNPLYVDQDDARVLQAIHRITFCTVGNTITS